MCRHHHQPQVRWPTFHLHQLAAVGMQPVRQGVRASSSRVTSARVPTVAKQARLLRSKQLSPVPHSVANTWHWSMMGTKRHPRPESCGFLYLPHTQDKWRSKQHGSHDINPVEICLKPSDQAYRSEKWIHLVSVHRSAHAREEYVVRLSTNWSLMAWEVVFPHGGASHEHLAMRSELVAWIWSARRTWPQSAFLGNKVGLRSSAGRTCRGPPRKRATSSSICSVFETETRKGHNFENEEEIVVAAQ